MRSHFAHPTHPTTSDSRHQVDHDRDRDHDHDHDHDRAFLRTLLILIAICVLAAVFGKAESYGQGTDKDKDKDKGNAAAASATAPTPAPAPATAPAIPPSSSPSPSPSYIPTVEQAKDLRISQLEALAAKRAFDDAIASLGALCQRVKTDNKWPAEVACDPNQNPVLFGVVGVPMTSPPAAASAPGLKK